MLKLIQIFIFYPIIIFSQNIQKSDFDKALVKEKISIRLSMTKKFSDNNPNYHLTIYKDKKPILEDKIFSKLGEIEFQDFNGDGIKDILVQNISDARSNWTYYLYLYDNKNKLFKKVKGFETIKNPTFNLENKIIESYVVSGKNYMEFYKINNSNVENLNISIFDDDSTNFDIEYKKVLLKIK